MKLDSPLFDGIRVKPEEDRRVRVDCPGCDWPGCRAASAHRAPKGRLREGEYWRFCLDHVREYNASYNFFAGMSDDAVARYQKRIPSASATCRWSIASRARASSTATVNTPRG